MSLDETMAALKEAGTEQNRKIYTRHGVKGPMFGVSFAILGKLKKQLKRDHALAGALWETGNHDARVLATMIADPAELTAKQVDAWIKDIDNYPLADAFSKLVADSPLGGSRMRTWMKSKADFVSATGWRLLSTLVSGNGGLPTDTLLDFVKTIEARIHESPNRTRHSMNGALIAIGSLGGAFEKAAVAAAKRIGEVKVDHGDTDCQTPDAVSYIAKIRARAKAAPKK